MVDSSMMCRLEVTDGILTRLWAGIQRTAFSDHSLKAIHTLVNSLREIVLVVVKW